MPNAPLLNLYVPYQKRQNLAAAQGIFGRIATAVQSAGWRIVLRNEYAPVEGEGYHLVHNRAVTVPHTLCLRRSYIDPFYSIEDSNDRWNWDVATKPFTPTDGAEWFLKHWRDIVFAGHEIREGGYVFMPLQGKLDERRHFQAMSPLDMIAATLLAEPARRILATLHPSENYTVEDLDALKQFDGRFEVSTQPSLDLLAGCDYVVTQNSSLAFKGFFAKKPAVLFAQIDFHHIAGSVPKVGINGAFAQLSVPPTFASYLHWFLRVQAISAWSDDAPARILQRMRDHGWPI
ncbi:MAG: hypothetical protein ABIV25_05755 [Paracoccaceae bacterium]